MSGLSDFFDGMHGVLFPFGGTAAPVGFLMCDGAAYNRITYASLYAAIGTNFGVGNGSTTFNVPDTRGVFLRGMDNGKGINPARVIGSVEPATTVANMPSATKGASNEIQVDVGNPDSVTSTSSAPWQTSATYTANQISSIMGVKPINLALNWIIKI
jgi:microcystin-dependent protein